MSNEFTPEEVVKEGFSLALDQLQEMDDEECVSMVRSFTECMSKWQPAVADLSDDPMRLSLTVSSLASLFNLAFCRAYKYTDRRLAAQEAIAKAFGQEVDE